MRASSTVLVWELESVPWGLMMRVRSYIPTQIHFSKLALYEDLKNVLCTDSAVTGESSGLALGLIMAGSKNPSAISDLVEYA